MGKKKFVPNPEERVDFNQYATDKILTVFESENLNPLAMEWLSVRPYNVNKGIDYNGVNRLIMSVDSALIKDPRYCPKGQVRDIGASNKGLNYDMRTKSGRTSFCAYNVQNLNNFESELFGIKSANTTYVENDNFVEAVHNLAETVENAVTVNFELLTSIILVRFMSQDINYPLGTIATSNKQWIKFIESDNTAICKASAEAQKRYDKILADCGLVEATPEAKATPKPTAKANTKSQIAKQKYKEIQKNMDPFGFVKAIDLSAFDKLGEKDLKRVMAILEKV